MYYVGILLTTVDTVGPSKSNIVKRSDPGPQLGPTTPTHSGVENCDRQEAAAAAAATGEAALDGARATAEVAAAAADHRPRRRGEPAPPTYEPPHAPPFLPGVRHALNLQRLEGGRGGGGAGKVGWRPDYWSEAPCGPTPSMEGGKGRRHFASPPIPWTD